MRKRKRIKKGVPGKAQPRTVATSGLGDWEGLCAYVAAATNGADSGSLPAITAPNDLKQRRHDLFNGLIKQQKGLHIVEGPDIRTWAMRIETILPRQSCQ